MAIVAHWPLTGHTNDISGNGHHGTNVGVTWADGKVGQAGVFAGTGDGKGIAGEYVSVPYEVTDIRQYEKGCTYTFWINVDADAANRIALLYGGATIDHIEIYSDSKYFRTEAVLQNGYSFGSGGFPDIVKGTWSHFAIVFDTVSEGRPVRWYQNGKLFYTGSLDNGNNPGEEYFYFNAIGRSTGSASYNYAPSFKGKINDVRIYDEALSPKQIYDISKAKVLHYTFSSFAGSIHNIIRQQFDTSFQDYDEGNTAGFSNQLGDGNYLGVDTGFGYRSDKSLRVNRGGTGSNGRVYRYYDMLQGDSCTVSMWVYAEEPGGFIHTEFSGGDYSWNGGGNSGTHQGTGWELLTWSLQTPLTSNTRLYYFYYPVLYNTDTWIDDIQLEKTHRRTEYSNSKNELTFDVIDSSGFNYDGILTGLDAYIQREDVTIGLNSYRGLGKSESYIYNTDFPDLINGITMSCWAYQKNAIVQHGSGTTTTSMIISKGRDASTNYGMNIVSLNGIIQVYVGEAIRLDTGISATDGWHHIVATYNPNGDSKVRVYIDGILTNTSAATTINYSQSYGALVIGKMAYKYNDNYGYYFPFDGYIDDVRIYATDLSEKDVLKLYQARFEENKEAEFYSKLIKQNGYYDDVVNNTNLSRNGDANLENNDNWSEFVYNSSEKCFTVTSGSKTVILDDFIKIKGDGFNNFDQYVLEAELKQPDIVSALSRYYFFIYCYDKNKQGIYYAYHYHRSGTETTLAATLNPGDTTVTVNDISNWYSDGTSNETHLKQIKVFSPTDEYPDYTYSRNRARYLSYSGNVITLKSAWTGPTIPAGSAICNTNDGGTYSYIGASNALMTQDWVKRKSNNTYTGSSSLRYGTEYVRIGFLINRNAGVETSYIRNLKFYNVTNPGQATEFDVDKLLKKQTGLLSLNNFSELGVMDKNLIFLKLLGDTIDDSGNSYNATASGATDRTEGYYFDGTDDHIEVPYGANFNPYEDQLSVSMYIKPIDIAPQWMCVSTGQSRGNGDTGARFYVGNVGSGNLDWGIKGAGWAGGSGKFIMSADTWYHIAVTFDGHNARLYANGQLIETRLYTSYLFNGNIWIGNHDGSHPFPGYIKNFKVFNGVLTPQQVAIEYRLMNKEIIEKNNILYLNTMSED